MAVRKETTESEILFSKIPESVVYIFFNILMFFPFHKHKRNARRDEL